FFLNDRNKKDTGAAGADLKPSPIESVGVIGAGIMGRGIAAANLRRDRQVTITDAAAAPLAAAGEAILAESAYDNQLKGTDPQRAMHIAARLHVTGAESDTIPNDLVIEAVVEDPGVKKAIFARLEPRLLPETILASNTSTIPIGLMAQGMTHPER